MSDSKKHSSILKFLGLLLFCSSIAFAGVNQKHFDFKKAAPAKTEIVENKSEESVKVSENATAEVKTSSSYFFIGTDGMWKWLVSSQKSLREKISLQVQSLKAGNAGSIWLFLLICFIYGLIHALGPGHGKTIVVSYFLARKGKILQGAGLGTSITTIHTLSAVILLFVLYGIAQATLFPIFEASRINIEKASYALIVLTGLILIFISVREMRHTPEDKTVSQNASWKELLWVAFITGIVPCPAVALIVFFCLLNKMPGIALLGALGICIGMAITNTAFGLVAIFARKGIDSSVGRFQKLGKYAGYINTGISLACGLCIGILGIFLFLNAR